MYYVSFCFSCNKKCCKIPLNNVHQDQKSEWTNGKRPNSPLKILNRTWGLLFLFLFLLTIAFYLYKTLTLKYTIRESSTFCKSNMQFDIPCVVSGE